MSSTETMIRIRPEVAADWLVRACQNLVINDSTNATHNSYKNIAQSAFDWAQYMTANTN